MSITTVGVVGGGLMGSGIAEVCASAGLRTRLAEINDDALEAARARIQRSLDRGRAGGKLSDADVARILARLDLTTDRDHFRDCDIVVEAIREHLGDKQEMFADLDRIVPGHAILASNTSALPIIDIASATRRPERVVGTHFFNPAPVMKLLELVRSVATDDATMAGTRAFGDLLGKRMILAQDRAGFIVNLLLIPFLTQAVRMHESGFASRDDIDAGMRLGCGHPMGPLELLDHVGLDTTLSVCEALHAEYAKEEYAPPPVLRRMVSAGWLGKKSGRGFYTYAGDGTRS
jgi:3-hydroxybutyryl-CoA dehydrogenase